MALNKLTITVIDGSKGSAGSSSDNAASDTKPNGKKSMMYKILNYNQTIKNKVKQTAGPSTLFALQTGIGLATQTAKQAINYYVSDIGRQNGDSNYQAIINRRIEQATDFISVGQGALGGAASGAMLGPIGAIAGGLMGAAGAGINLGFKYAARERDYSHTMFQENTSQAYNLARANYSAMTGRVR